MARISIAVSYEGADNELGRQIIDSLQTTGATLQSLINKGTELVQSVKDPATLAILAQALEGLIPTPAPTPVLVPKPLATAAVEEPTPQPAADASAAPAADPSVDVNKAAPAATDATAAEPAAAAPAAAATAAGAQS